MAGLNRITSDPAVIRGQPCIRGMRLTVRRVLEALATYPDREELFAEYPELEDEDIRQALAYAAANLDDKVVELHEVPWSSYSIKVCRVQRFSILKRWGTGPSTLAIWAGAAVTVTDRRLALKRLPLLGNDDLEASNDDPNGS
jgi:uncharacterized protein (DUF433 family)